MKYRKKPVVIEARCLTRDVDEMGRIAMWCGGEIAWDGTRPCGLDIETLEGVMRANLGDYVIKGVKGEFYPCKPDIFRATYDPV